MLNEDPASNTYDLPSASEKKEKLTRANKWEVQLTGEDQLKATYVKEFLWNNHIVPRRSKYAMLQYCIILINDVICKDEIIEIRDLLFELGAIPRKSLIDTMHYIVAMGKQSIKDAISQLGQDKEKEYEEPTQV